MKRHYFIALFLFVVGSSLQAGETVHVKVKGMVCSFCAQGLSKAFKLEPAIEKIEVVMKKKTLSLKLKEGATLDDKTITQFITDSGYNVEKIERTR